VEPIQGEGGVVVPRPDYLKGLRDLCDERRVLLIFDEVQVGMGRTGRLFAHEHFGVAPDIMTLAKAMANGLPMGAMLAREALSSAFGPGSHATTFGGTPLVTAVAGAVLRSLLEDGWLEHCHAMGEYFRGRLAEMAARRGCIRGVRGLGLIIGLELDVPGGPIVRAAMDKGFLINCTQDRILRFIPPLIVQADEIDRLCVALDKILADPPAA